MGKVTLVAGRHAGRGSQAGSSSVGCNPWAARDGNRRTCCRAGARAAHAQFLGVGLGSHCRGTGSRGRRSLPLNLIWSTSVSALFVVLLFCPCRLTCSFRRGEQGEGGADLSMCVQRLCEGWVGRHRKPAGRELRRSDPRGAQIGHGRPRLALHLTPPSSSAPPWCARCRCSQPVGARQGWGGSRHSQRGRARRQAVAAGTRNAKRLGGGMSAAPGGPAAWKVPISAPRERTSLPKDMECGGCPEPWRGEASRAWGHGE